jgi:hypothetical protein
VRTGRSTALRTVLAAAVPVGLVLSAAVVWQSTSAAFTASTANEGNSWKAGTVALSTSSSAIFSTGSDGALTPGSSRSRCLHVDYAGDLPATVVLYVTTPATGLATLDPYLVMSVEQGRTVDTATATTAGTVVMPDCTNFASTAGTATFVYNTATAGSGAVESRTMSHLKTTHGTYANGIPVGTGVAQGTSLTFKVTYWVRDVNDAQGTQTDATFTWRAENT